MKHVNERFRLESVALPAPCFRPKRSRIGRSIRRRLQGARHRRNMPTDASDWNPRFSPPPCPRPKRSRIGRSVRRRRQGARHRRNMPTNVSDRNPWRSPPRASARNVHESAGPSAGGCKALVIGETCQRTLPIGIRGSPRPHALVRNVHESACPSAGGSGPMTSTSSATTATELSSSSLSSIGENSGLSGASVILTCLQPSSPAIFSLR